MTKNQIAYVIATVGVAFWAAMIAVGAAGTPQLSRAEIPGVRNVTQVEPTIACAGATSAASMPIIAANGYKTVVNLRLASEDGADVEASRAAAIGAGVVYVHLPYEVARPDAQLVDRFIETVTNPDRQPIFIHCASANRVAGLWMVKRVIVDGWDTARAEAEARAIGLSNPTVRDFALAEIARRKR